MTEFRRKRPWSDANFVEKSDIWASTGDRSADAGYGGYYGGDADASSAPEQTSREQTFPTELVAYLRNVVDIGDGQFEPALLEKCLEECEGHEGDLCFFQESGRLVETLFASESTSALAFLVRLQRLKNKRRLELLTAGCASRVIEQLMCALPDEKGQLSPDAVESLADWTALLSEEWLTLVTSRGGAHVVRSLARLLCGLPRQTETAESPKNKRAAPSMSKATLSPSTQHHFRSLLSRALDWNLMKEVIRTESASCLMQDFVVLDRATKSGQLDTFLSACYDEQQNDAVLGTWRDKQASRVWEKIVESSSEDVVERIYQSIVQGQLTALSLNRFANFPIQRLLARAKSPELIADVFDELLPNLAEIAAAGYYGIVCAMCTACERADEDLQETFLKELRSLFGCTKKADKTKFLAHVLCLNTHLHHLEQTGGKVYFDVNQAKVQGSLLVQSLLRLQRHRTLLAGLFALAPSTLVDVAKHSSASHILDAFLASKAIASAQKKQLVALFTGSWCALACDKFGSRVLDSCWKYAFDIDDKCAVANELNQDASVLRRTPIGRLMHNKYELSIFAEDVKRWRKTISAQENKAKLLATLTE